MTHHKEVWKKKLNLIFISIQLSEMHGTLRVKNGKHILNCTDLVGLLSKSHNSVLRRNKQQEIKSFFCKV